MALLLTSCENFLKAGEVKTQIEDAIAYNNAKDISINLFCKEEMGIILPGTTVSGKLGYNIELQFIPNTDNYVIKNKNKIFEAVSRKDNSVSLEDYVEFTPVEQSEIDKKEGIYRAKVKVIKENSDILIRPVCLLYPKVVSYSPSSDSASFANTPIIITFNTLIPKEKINGNIAIRFGGIDHSTTLFDTPVVNEVLINEESKTQVIIKPKALDLRNFIQTEQKASVIDFNITCGTEIGIKDGNLTSPLKQDSNSTFSIRYSAEIELEPPKENAFFVTAHEIELDSVETVSEGKFAMEDFNLSSSNADSQKIVQNKCGSIIYLYGKYFDEGSGVKSVTVVEQRIKARVNYTSVDEPEIPVTYFNDSDNAEFYYDGTGFTTFYIKHPIQSEEGAVQFTVNVNDYCDNASETKNFIAMKMDSIGESFTNALYNSSGNTAPTYEYYINNYKKMRLTLGHNKIYGNIYDENERFIVTGEYVDRNGVECSEQFSYTSDSNYILELNVDSLNALPFFVVISDEFGHERKVDFTFPASPVIKSVTPQPEREDGKYEVVFYDSGLVYEVDAQGNGTLLTSHSLGQGISGYYCDPNLDYYVCSRRYSYYGEPEVFKINNSPSLSNVVVSEAVASKSEQTGFFDIKITIAADSWKEFDRIFVDDSSTAVWNFSKNTLSHTISYSFSNADKQHIIYGSKGVYRSSGTPINVVIDKAALDNQAPVIANSNQGNQTWKSSFEDADYYNYKLTDDYNDINYGELYFNFYDQYLDADEIAPETEFIFHIPVWSLEEASKKNNSSVSSYYSSSRYTKAYFECEDAQENYQEEYKNLYFNTLIPFKVSGYTYDETSPTCDLQTGNISKNGNSFGTTVYVAKLSTVTDPESENPLYYGVWGQEGAAQTKTAVYDNNRYKISGVNVPKDSFVKILVKTDVFADAQYLYTGTAKNTKEYDYIIANGSSKESVVVSSDAPVFVHTLVTKNTYEECKDWSAEEWEHHRRHVGDKFMSFTTGSLPKTYTIPMDIIEDDGWNCYVVIAHFADGTTAKSEVMY